MSRKIRILVFEDDALIRMVLEQVLESRGYEVFLYGDPTKCPLYSSDEYSCSNSSMCADMIISDIRMPNIDGLTFVKEQLNNGCGVKPENIAMISGFWSSECSELATTLGVSILHKPFTFDFISGWLDKREKGLDLNQGLLDSDKFQVVDEDGKDDE